MRADSTDDDHDRLEHSLFAPAIGHGLIARFRLRRWLVRFPDRPVWATFVLVNSFLTAAILALVSHTAKSAFVFPSLGPTAFLFFYRPTAPAAMPRHAIFGHAIGIACGYAALRLFGFAHSPSGMVEGTITLARGLAVAFSLGLTGAAMVLCRVAHPPAAATTMIVSLGIISAPFHLAIIEVAVVLLTLQALVINRWAGIAYPLWESGTRR